MMISVVIPLYNEGSLVIELLDRVFETLIKTGDSFEVVCVNDGSRDSTLDLLKSYREKNKALKIVDLSRNYGLQAALTAGISHAKGDFTVVMDGDFQDPPELISVMIYKIMDVNADIVTAVRNQRREKA
jgi:dolichol-phosphate mannosyltransferase